MANYSQLKQSVKNVIKQNGQQEITGDVLQSVLISIITNLGTHAQFSGIASLDGNPGTPDGNEFYLAVKPGTYTNFNGITVTESDGLSILVNMDGTWKKLTTGTAMKTDITTLQGTINSLSSTLQTVKSDLDTAEKSITTLQGRTLPLSVSFDIDKIDALTDSSGSTDIKAAFTPLSGIGVAPVAGNILRSGNVIKNSQEVTIIWSDYDSKTAYYSFSYVIDNVLKIFQTDAKTFVRVAKIIVGGDVGAEIEDLQDRVSIGKAPVWITFAVEREPGDVMHDDFGDIFFIKGGNYLKEVVRSATGRKTLGPAVDMETGRLYVYGGNLCKWEDGDFVPFYLDDINTLKSKARYEYNLQKIFALSSFSGTEDIEEALTPTYAPDGNTAMRLPQSGDLLEATNGATSVVLKGTSKTFSFFYGNNRRDITLSGSAGNYKVMVEVTPMGVHVFDLDKLNALTDESTPENIEEAFRRNYPTAGDLLEGADESSWVIMSGSEASTLARTFTYHTSGKLRTLTVSGDQGNETIKVEETVLVTEDTNNFVRPELQIQDKDLRIKAPAGALKETDEVWFYRRGQWRIRPLNEETKRYQTFKKSGWRRMNTVAKPSDLLVQLKFNKGVSAGLVVKLVSQGGSSDYDLFKVRIEDEENSDAAFTDFFRYFFCEYIDKKSYSDPKVIFRMKNGRNNKDITVGKSTKAGLLQRVQRWGLAVWRNGERITPVMEFNVTGYIVSPRLETVSSTDLKIGLS